MPTNKHKRKASAQSKTKRVRPPGLITTHAKFFLGVGVFFIAISIYLLIFKAHDNAMFGLAMLALISGVVLTISAKMVSTKNNKN